MREHWTALVSRHMRTHMRGGREGNKDERIKTLMRKDRQGVTCSEVKGNKD